MKTDRIGFLLIAFLLFLTTLTAVSLPTNLLLALQLIVPALGLYAAVRARRISVKRAVSLLLIAVFYNPLTVPVYDERTGRIVALAIAAAFIRLAFHNQPTAPVVPRES